MKFRILSLLTIVALAGSIFTIAAKKHTTQKDLPGTIDGAVTPSAIPDHVAYEMFFTSLAPPPGGDSRAEGAMKAKLAQIGLSESDGGALRWISGQFISRRNDIDKQVDAMRDQNLPAEAPSTLARLEELQKQKQSLTGEMKDLIGQRLTADGAAKVSQHVNEYVKRRIKIVPPSHR